MAAGGKTYKLEQATQEKLQAISDEMAVFEYEQQKKK